KPSRSILETFKGGPVHSKVMTTSDMTMTSAFLSAPLGWSSQGIYKLKGKQKVFRFSSCPWNPAGPTNNLLQRSQDVCVKARLILTSALPRGVPGHMGFLPN
ncbi:hypothetical protein AMECASPLE_005686, partial [Ameca splendens]